MAEMITFREGVLEALFEEMRADPSVILMGEDVGAAGGVFTGAVRRLYRRGA